MILQEELLINGCLVGGSCDSSVPKQLVSSPYDGRRVGVAAESTTREIEAAISAADASFQAWSRTPLAVRRELLGKVADLLESETEAFAELMALEIGKPLAQGRAEVTRAAVTVRSALELTESYDWEEAPPDTDLRASQYARLNCRAPLGVIFAITPYNWPINLAMHKLAPALLAGNTIILKGSALASLCTLRVAKLFQAAGFPPGVVNSINCSGEEAQACTQDQRVAMVSFTGSPAVGWKLKKLLPMKRVALELGGNATQVALPSCEINQMVTSVTASAFSYAGQSCISAQNLLVHAELMDPVREALIQATRETVFGDPLHEGVICGPLISQDALTKVQGMMSGDVIVGGKAEGLVLEPTLLESPSLDSDAVRKEIFGPVLNLIRIESLSEAISIINGFESSIHSAIFSNDEQEIAQFAESVETPGVVINDSTSIRFDSMPYGGEKLSGFGREGTAAAVEEFTRWKTRVRRVN